MLTQILSNANTTKTQVLLGLLFTPILVCFSTGSARASCTLPTTCCFDMQLSLDGVALAQADVVSVGQGVVGLSLIQTPIYCEKGVECTSGIFPEEVIWGDSSCLVLCSSCDEIAVGIRGLFLVDIASSCILTFRKVASGGAECMVFDDLLVPVDFALENGMITSNDCEEAYRTAGYWFPCDDREGCSHSVAGCFFTSFFGILLVGIWLSRKFWHR
jgi:hypothetical protein